MDNIEVSVIVPVYNCGQYIGKTLDSIINQDFDNFEIIVIDDGSTDNSLDVINDSLKDTVIPNKIIHQENAGVSVARNRGIDASNGNYLVFVDADDYVLPNHLSELYGKGTDFSLIQYAKKQGDSITNPNHFDRKIMSCEEFIRMELNMEMTLNFFQIMYKSEIIKGNDIRFTPGVVYGEDTEFSHKALSFGDKISISNEVTYYYVQRDDSAIKTTEFKRFDIVNTFERLAQFYENQGKSDLANLITTSRIPKAIFGNMNYFFVNSYDFDEVMSKMKELNLFDKLKKFEGDKKFKLKIKLFLFNPRIYYIVWKKLKNSID